MILSHTPLAFFVVIDVSGVVYTLILLILCGYTFYGEVFPKGVHFVGLDKGGGNEYATAMGDVIEVEMGLVEYTMCTDDECLEGCTSVQTVSQLQERGGEVEVFEPGIVHQTLHNECLKSFGKDQSLEPWIVGQTIVADHLQRTGKSDILQYWVFPHGTGKYRIHTFWYHVVATIFHGSHHGEPISCQQEIAGDPDRRIALVEMIDEQWYKTLHSPEMPIGEVTHSRAYVNASELGHECEYILVHILYAVGNGKMPQRPRAIECIYLYAGDGISLPIDVDALRHSVSSTSANMSLDYPGRLVVIVKQIGPSFTAVQASLVKGLGHKFCV